MRQFCLLLIVLLPLSSAAAADADIETFLSSRRLVAQVFFAQRSAELSAASQHRLDVVVEKLRDYAKRQMLIRVEGYSSPKGNEHYNVNLSLQRALSVKDYLQVRHQLDAELFLTGFGEKHHSDGTLAEMRRVDIAVYKKNQAARALFEETGNIERFNLQ